MLKILSFTFILFGLLNNCLCQTKIIPKDVESKITQNRNINKPIHQNITVLYSFKSGHLTSREHAQNFDNKIIINNNIL